MTLSDQIRRAIRAAEHAGLSRYRLAKETGVNQASLSRFIHGGSITTKTLDALANVLRLRLESKGPTKAVLARARR